MKRLLKLSLCAMAVISLSALVISEAQARKRHSHGNVCSKSGACASVSPAHAAKFQCVVNHLDSVGYRIYFMGGYRNSMIAGTNYVSKHASGRAIDINQTSRNRCKGGCARIPAVARACGLFDGSQWRHADAGHFEVPGVVTHGTRYAHSHKYRRTYASLGSADMSKVDPR